MSSGEKRFITGTNPRHGFETPDGMANSLVDKHGRMVDTGWNFDEFDDDKEEESEPEKTGWDEIAENS